MSTQKFKLSNQSKSIITVLIITIVIAFAYFPPLLEGKVLNAADVNHWQGMSKEIRDYHKDTGETSLWTNSMFGGMPTFLIHTKYPGNLIDKINTIYHSNVPRPANYIISFILFFFLLMLILKVNIWVSFIGAIAFAMNAAFFAWIEGGHVTKAHTLTFMAIVVAGVLLAYKKDALKGAILAGFGLSFMLVPNHPQMTYYAGLMVIIIGITYFIYAIREKTLPNFIKSSFFLLIAAALALGTNYSKLSTTLEYGKYSIRGKSELTSESNDKTSGLDKSYILDYSYDFGEAMTAFIPRFKGGSMAEPLGEDSHFYKELSKTQGKARAKSIAANAPLYWGSQPISGAPFYYGAVLCFLFVFGLFVVKGKEKWWVLSTVIFSFLLSLGKYLPALADFMVEYFPGYNKFRDVKNIIVIQQFSMAVLGVLVIKEIYERKLTDKQFLKKLKFAFAISGGIALIFAIIPSLAGDFVGDRDAMLLQQGWPQNLVNALIADRKSVLRADAFRTFLFIALGAATLWAYWTKKLKAQYALIIWGILVLGDMWPVNKRHLNNDDFINKRKSSQPYSASNADNAILKDKSLNYRVLNMTVNPWSDASTSFFHKSIGGYHGAKMQRYQELIENTLSPEMQKIGGKLRNVKTQADLDGIFSDLDGLNMLNTRYFIINKESAPLFNNNALGNAWFVPNYRMVENADAEIAAIQNFDVQKEAIVDQRFSKYVEGKTFGTDSTASITLTKYAPNALEYQSNASKEQLAVFSEIYYPAGWKAFIDGEEVPHFRVNYVLRSMVVPAGKHTIEFKFHPETYYAGNRISLISSILLFLALGGVIILEIRKKKLNKSA